MGILSGKDIFSAKFITAIITDASSQIHFIPIKHTIGDYFLAEIDGQTYCFRIEGSRIKTWRRTLAKSFRVIQYDTVHYLPISAENVKEIENVLTASNLPRINGMLFNILKYLGKKEKNPFEAHDLTALVETLNQETKYAEHVQNIKNYLTHLDTTKIVKPVRKISEFIEEDLITSDPKFFGAVTESLKRADFEHKKMTNTPINAKGPWLKVMLFVLIIGLIGGVGYYLYTEGTFEGGLGIDFDNPGQGLFGGGGDQGKNEPKWWIDRYSPVELKAAIDRGEVDESELPPEIKEMVDQVKLPEVEG